MMSAASGILAVEVFGWGELALQAALLLTLLALSAVFSGSETVLFSLTRVQLEKHKGSSNPFRRWVPRLMARPKETLLTILICNTAVNVLLFATSYVLFDRLGRQWGPWVRPVSAVCSVLLVVVCGEVIPKVLAVKFADRLAPFSAAVVRGAGTVAEPIGRLIDAVLARPVERMMLGPQPRPASKQDVTIDELKALLHLSRQRGDIDRVENEFLREVIDLRSVRVREVMVPRVDVVAYDVNQPAEGLRDLMRSTRLKKVPVYEGSVDNLIGVVYAKVLFLNPGRPLRELIVPVRFVPEVATCEDLLQHFRETGTQLAIVVDEYGGMAGLVTLEDVLEQIVGDLSEPEEAPTAPEVVPLSDTEYEVSGRLDVRYWAQLFGLPRLAERVVTVGGLVTARLGRPARPGDTVRLGNIELRVTGMHGRRVERVQLRLMGAGEPREEWR